MVENNHPSTEECNGKDSENEIDRRKFLGAAAAVPYGAKVGKFDSRFMRMSGPVTVTTEAELNDALGKHSEIALGNDITLTKTLQEDLGSSDLTLDLSLNVLAKADSVNARMIELTTTGNIEITNGDIDCNRDGQNFPTVKTKEVNLFGGQTCRITDVKIIDNSNYGFAVEDFDEAIFDSAQVDSNPGLLTDTSNAAGLDGIHTFDVPTVEIRNPNITSGDDGIAVAANDRSVEQVTISGGNVSSPVYANGVRFHVQSGAAPDTTISGVEIDSDINNCKGQGIIIVNESTNGNVIRDVAITGTVRGVGDDGIRTLDPVENVSVSADVSDTGANGVNIAGGGDTVAVNASISGADVNGVHAQDTQDVVVTASSIEDCGNWPIISKGSSNNWIVTENSWRKNRFSTISLANDENTVAFNTVG